MKRILYIWQASYPWDIRVEKICSALRDNGFEVIIMARWKPGQQEHEYIDNIHIVRVGYNLPSQLSIPISLNPLWYQAIRKSIDKFQPALIIAREILLAEAAAKIAHQSHIPIIMDMAEHYPAVMRGWKKYSRNYFIRYLVHNRRLPDSIEKNSVIAMDGILTVCKENSDRLASEYGYPLAATQVVHNTPKFSWFEGIKTGLSASPTQFAHHGFITPIRGLDVFIQGFAIVLASISNLRLTLAGTGESYLDLTTLIQKLYLQDHITLSGAYKHSDVAQLYESTDIGILPYHIDAHLNHTIPNKLFDYMACGKPVLVSKAQPMKRIIEETGAGLSIDCTSPQNIAEGIQTLLQSDTQGMSTNGRKAFYSKYNWEKDTESLLTFLGRYI